MYDECPFGTFRPDEKAVVSLDILEYEGPKRPEDIAQAIIDSSEGGAISVDFRAKSPVQYFVEFLHERKAMAVGIAIREQGYDFMAFPNAFGDGVEYVLTERV